MTEMTFMKFLAKQGIVEGKKYKLPRFITSRTILLEYFKAYEGKIFPEVHRNCVDSLVSWTLTGNFKLFQDIQRGRQEITEEAIALLESYIEGNGDQVYSVEGMYTSSETEELGGLPEGE